MNGLPVVVAQRRDSAHSELDLVVAPDSPWFEGHFPNRPVLPGVVQIGWAVHFARELHDLKPTVAALEQIKFKRPIMPGTRLTLHLTPGQDGQKLRYEYRDAATSYSSGTLNFGAAV